MCTLGPIGLGTNAVLKTDDTLTISFSYFTAAKIFHKSLTISTFMGVLGVCLF